MSTETIDLSETPAKQFLNTPEGRAILRRNLDRYTDGPTRVAGGKTDYVIRCVLPDHSDEHPSMVVTFEDDDAQVFCRSHPGGWDQDKLFEAAVLIAQEDFQTWASPTEQVEDHDNGTPPTEESSAVVIEVRSSSKWFEEYTNIPFSEWESWGTEARAECIGFTSKQSPAVRLKYPDGRRLVDPTGARLPYTWPDIPDKPGVAIWLCEGETDCGVLRHFGLPAYSYGSRNANPPTAFWESLKAKEVQVIYLLPDIDDPGRDGVKKLKQKCIKADLPAVIVDISSVLNVGAGEKDVRDLWLREGEATKKFILHCLSLAFQPKDPYAIPFTAYRRKYLDSPIEIIPGWLQRGMIQLIIGEPGRFKSWLALHEAMTIAFGIPFLGTLQPKITGNVEYDVMEDAHTMINARIALLQGASIRTFEVDKVSNGKAGRRLEIKYPNTPPDVENRLFIHDRRDFDVTDDESWDEKERFIKENNIVHSFTDPLFAAVGRDASGDYFTQAAMMIATRGKILRDRTGCGLTFVHHTSHAGNAWGSVFLGALREGRIDIKGLSDNEIAVKRFVKSIGYLPRLKLTFDVPPPPSEQEFPLIPDIWFGVDVERYTGADVRSVKKANQEGSILSQVLESLETPEWVFWTVEELASALIDVEYAESTKKDKVRAVLRELLETDGEERVVKRQREREPGERVSPEEFGLASRNEDL